MDAASTLGQIIYENLLCVGDCFNIKKNLWDEYVIPIFSEDEKFNKVIQYRNHSIHSLFSKKFPFPNPGTTLNGMVLYCLIRYFNLKSCLETGVASGYYSYFLLNALKENSGSLTSVEIMNDENIGLFAREHCEQLNHWNLIKQKDSLVYLKENEMNFDIYCHDSLHIMSHMTKELLEFKRCNLDRFFVFFDDQNSQNFWQRAKQLKLFDKKGYKVYKVECNSIYVTQHLGGFLMYERDI